MGAALLHPDATQDGTKVSSIFDERYFNAASRQISESVLLTQGMKLGCKTGHRGSKIQKSSEHVTTTQDGPPIKRTYASDLTASCIDQLDLHRQPLGRY